MSLTVKDASRVTKTLATSTTAVSSEHTPQHTVIPDTSGGLTTYSLVSAATTNATSVKASAGQVYEIEVFNTNASARYLKLYNKATAPTVGTDTPYRTYTIPGNASGAGLVRMSTIGFPMATGIAFALTTGAAASDTGAVAANEIVINIGYK